LGRRILLLVGTFGISVSLLLCAYGFHNATYQLNSDQITAFEFENADKLESIAKRQFTSDVEFKKELKSILGNQIYSKNDGAILEAATNMNADLVLYGILGFIACFAFSLGPVMWVLLSELYPLKIRGLAIGMIAFVNSLVSSVIQLIFPWELSNLGNAMTFFLFGAIALVGFVIMVKIVPETKGKTLEELELELTKN
jgi:MFS family permease